jgi:hypothetical protein
MHHAANLALGFALGYGLAVRSGDPLWSAAGFSIAAGWTGLSLHNDCLYKSFFQRLKRATDTYRIEGGRGGRPAPAARWPRLGIRALTWPAYKACEPHVVLLALTVLALLALLVPTAWIDLWREGVRMMALLAPLLASARVARSVRDNAAEVAFDRWFQEEHAAETGIGKDDRKETARPDSGSPCCAHAPRRYSVGHERHQGHR